MKKLKILFLTSVFAVFATFSGNSAFAESGEKPDYKITISPSIDMLEILEPGTQRTGSFEVLNEGTKDFEYDISFAPYTVESESYEANFTKENKYTDIKNWLKVDSKEGLIKSGEKAVVKYTIDIPEDFHGGLQSGAILVTMRNEQETGGNINAVRQVAYIVYGNVDGEITETGKVLENKIPSFLFKPPISATSIVENTGNVYTAAEYKLQVFPLFSDEEVFTNEETPDSSVVFPETKRFNQMSWDGAPQLGIFRVRQTVKIFDDESTVEKLVFLCPIWFLFIVLLIIFMIIFWIVSRIMHRKKEASE